MWRRAWLSWFSMLLALAASAVGCGKTEGTYVRLKFSGTVNDPALFRRIDLDLSFDTRTDSATYLAPNQGIIALPTDALIKIRHGEGELSVSARALAADSTVLGVGEGKGSVRRDKIVDVTIHFAPSAADAGMDGTPALDGAIPNGDATSESTEAAIPTRDMGELGGGTDLGGSGGDAGVDAPLADAPSLGDTSDSGLAGQRTDGSDGQAGTGGATGASSETGGGTSATDGSGTTDGPGADVPGAGYRLSVNPPSLDFGIVLPGGSSIEQTLTVTNTGDAATPALAISISDPQSYPVSSNTCTRAVLNPKDTCTVTLIFAPATSGTFPANGSVGPVGEATATFQLIGAGASASPALSLLPTTADFGVVNVNETTALAFTVRNTGTAAAGTLNLQVTGSSFFAIAGDDCSGKVLAAQGQCFFGVTFAPTAYGAASATIRAMSSLGLIATVTASGTGRDTVPVSIDFAGTGRGTVTGTGIECSTGDLCAVTVPRTAAGDSLILTATPAAESAFTGWAGQGCTGTGTCTVSLDASPRLTATFTATHYTLAVAKAGTGAGRSVVRSTPAGYIDCGATCSASIKIDQSVTLTATAYVGNTFTGWSGACKGIGDCVVSMTAAKSVTATFALEKWDVIVEKKGPGTGTVTSSPAGIDCDPGCTTASGKFDDLSQVTLTATPSVGSVFKGWLGTTVKCPGLTNTCTVAPLGRVNVSAYFALRFACGNLGSGARTCSLGEMSVEVDLGPLTAGDCSSQCEDALNQTPYATAACWTVSDGHCYCRDGQLVVDPEGTAIAGDCKLAR